MQDSHECQKHERKGDMGEAPKLGNPGQTSSITHFWAARVTCLDDMPTKSLHSDTKLLHYIMTPNFGLLSLQSSISLPGTKFEARPWQRCMIGQFQFWGHIVNIEIRVSPMVRDVSDI